MASGSGSGGNGEGKSNSMFSSVIAQAEAAIMGNLNAAADRRTSRASSRPIVHRSHTGASTRTNHLEVPNILSDADLPEAPPAYGEKHDQIEISQDGFNTRGDLTEDGRINITINQKTRKLSDLLVPALRNQLALVEKEEYEHPLPPGYIPPALGGLPGQTLPPKLNVVIHVVGSRGDVQPFVALGKTLKSTYGHRVRVATHPTFKTFVEENGLEFFSIGGDPSELMAFMVKNPGLMPGIESLKSGDVGKRRKGMEEIVLGCWRSCIEAGDGLGAPPSRESSEFDAGINMETNPADRPFVADAIIANPPSFAHIHIAEKMGIPLHMMFTMPWSPTQQFPHPLANIQSTNADVNMTNFISYAMVEMMTWQGLGDVINRFRERALGLDPISLIWAPGMLSRLRIPYTYCWSPALIPKPKDWGMHISISGFYFLSLASSYTPAPDLAAFLAAGPPPVYIGFGSIVVDDPNAMTTMIFTAIKKAGIRALVSKGWGGFGGDSLNVPEGVFMLGNVPHDWLFQHVSAVVHHGGAGTTAAGIALGKPTVIVPFFGDQPFWGAMVARAGAGPVPIPYKQLTADKLATAIEEALKPQVLERAKELGAKIKEEKGTETGGKSFHDQLKVDELRCSVSPSRVAVWTLKKTHTRLSALAANVLANEGLIDFADLKLYRAREYETEDGPWDPISGGASALLGTIASLTMGIADFPIEIFRAVKKQQAKKSNSSHESDSPPIASSGSGANTPTASTPASRADTSSDLTTSSDASTMRSSEDTTSTSKTFYDGPSRSSIETGQPSASTPGTSTSSLNRQGTNTSMNSLKAALRGTLDNARSRSCSRSRSRSHSRTNSRSGSPYSPQRRDFDPSHLTLENATRAGKGISRIVGAGLKSPMDFTLGLARGFHNAPKLYGDDTVRPQEKVTDFQSGLRAAGKEFIYGFSDGITGLVTQPMRGAEKEGAAGLVKGIGKGIGGLILKPGAAIWGIPGYTFMGIHKEVRKMFGSSVINYIISARTAQGFEDAQNASEQDKRDIIARWREHKEEYLSAKKAEEFEKEHRFDERSPSGFMHTRNMTFDERKRYQEERKAKKEAKKKAHAESGGHLHGGKMGKNCPFCRREAPHDHTPRPMAENVPSVTVADGDDSNVEFENAIKASVAATSRGNPQEDEIIERAIRASVRELQSAQGSAMTDEEALQKAIQASIKESSRVESHDVDTDAETERGPIVMSDKETEHQAMLEKAIQESLAQYSLAGKKDVDSDDDEDLKLALELSKSEPPKPEDDDEDEMLRLALQKSQEDLIKSKGKTEEEIVMEYVMKQSLLEDESRGRTLSVKEGKKPEVKRGQEPERVVAPAPALTQEEQDSAADEEALQKAIEESMKHTAGSG